MSDTPAAPNATLLLIFGADRDDQIRDTGGQVTVRGSSDIFGLVDADHPHHRRCRTGEWRGAEPAAWPVWQEPEDAPIPALVRAANGQEVVPEGLIARIGRWLLVAHAGPPPPRPRRRSPLPSLVASVKPPGRAFVPASILDQPTPVLSRLGAVLMRRVRTRALDSRTLSGRVHDRRQI